MIIEDGVVNSGNTVTFDPFFRHFVVVDSWVEDDGGPRR